MKKFLGLLVMLLTSIAPLCNGNIVEGFEDGTLGGWFSPQGGGFSVESTFGGITPYQGEYFAASAKNSSYFWMEKSITPQTGTVSGYINIVEVSTNQSCAGLYVNGTGGYAYIFIRDGQLIWRLGTNWNFGSQVELGVWHEVKFVVTDTGVSGYFDGQLLFSDYVPVKKIEKISFGSMWVTAAAAYDNISIPGESPAEPVSIQTGWFDNAEWSTPTMIANGGGKFVVLYAGVATPQEKIQQYLDEAQAQSVKIVLSVKEMVDIGDTTALMNRVNAFKNHPAISGWYIMDEPYHSGTTLSNCETAYTMIKQVSDKPIYAAFYDGDLSHNTPYTYRNAFDVMMYDNYPFEHGEGQFTGLSSWKNGCNQARDQAQAIGKPLHMILQGYGYIPANGWTKRLPTYQEERFMVFYSLFNGASGIEFWEEVARLQSVAVATDPYPYDGWQWMGDVCEPVMQEINRMRLTLGNGPIDNAVSDNQEDVRAKVYQNPVSGQYYLVALNDTTGSKNVTFTLALPTSFTYAVPLHENRNPISIQNGVFSDTFTDYGVHNYLLVSELPSTLENVVLGNSAGKCWIRSEMDLGWIADTEYTGLSAGAVLPNGNVALGSKGVGGKVMVLDSNITDNYIAREFFTNDITAMAADSDGNIVFVTTAGALHKRSGADLSAIVSSGGFGSNAIKDIAIAPNGNIILAAVYASGRYICVTDGMFGAVPGVPTNYSTFGNAGAVAVQPNGNIVIGNDVGSLWVCTGQLTINQTATGLGNITDIAVQPNGNIVVGNAQGVVKILDGNNIANVISSDSDFGRVYKLACLSNGDVVVASAANSGQLQIRDANDLTVIKAHDYGCGVVTFLGVQPVQDVTIPGDANKDGMVNVGDLGILAANYGRNLQTDGVASELWWSLGDFNLDGQVNVGDLGILAANYGQGVNAAADFEADYAKIFGTSAEEDSADETDGSICSALGLPLVIGLLLMGLMLMKLED